MNDVIQRLPETAIAPSTEYGADLEWAADVARLRFGVVFVSDTDRLAVVARDAA